MTELVFFLLGCIAGWMVNHWYSVNMRMPHLRVNGGGYSSNLLGSGYKFNTLTVENELRRLGINLPTTIILGKSLRTYFGYQVVERNDAKDCTIRLLDEKGKFICHLWWLVSDKVYNSVDIKSGKQANFIVFIRKDNDFDNYYAYQPESSTNFNPKTVSVPKFSKTMNFKIQISYLYGSKIVEIPVSVIIGYDGNFSFETPNSASMF